MFFIVSFSELTQNHLLTLILCKWEILTKVTVNDEGLEGDGPKTHIWKLVISNNWKGEIIYWINFTDLRHACVTYLCHVKLLSKYLKGLYLEICILKICELKIIQLNQKSHGNLNGSISTRTLMVLLAKLIWEKSS